MQFLSFGNFCQKEVKIQVAPIRGYLWSHQAQHDHLQRCS
jgi:hypothetical protein